MPITSEMSRVIYIVLDCFLSLVNVAFCFFQKTCITDYVPENAYSERSNIIYKRDNWLIV